MKFYYNSARVYNVFCPSNKIKFLENVPSKWYHGGEKSL